MPRNPRKSVKEHWYFVNYKNRQLPEKCFLAKSAADVDFLTTTEGGIERLPPIVKLVKK